MKVCIYSDGRIVGVCVCTSYPGARKLCFYRVRGAGGGENPVFYCVRGAREAENHVFYRAGGAREDENPRVLPCPRRPEARKPS